MMVPSPILMICDGNLCRSPFAEFYLNKRLEDAGVYSKVFSRGLLALPNQRPPKNAQLAAAEFDIDLASHVSQPLLRTDLDQAAMVMVMEARQRQHIAKMSPASVGKVFLLSQMTNGNPIADPVGKDLEAFRSAYKVIATDMDAWAKRFGISPASH